MYNSFDNATLNDLVKELKLNGLFPFRKIVGEKSKKIAVYNGLRLFINLKPVAARAFYHKLRDINGNSSKERNFN